MKMLAAAGEGFSQKVYLIHECVNAFINFIAYGRRSVVSDTSSAAIPNRF
jgi:hypothetical protein